MGQGERRDEERAPDESGAATLPGVAAPPPSPADVGTMATQAGTAATQLGTAATAAPASPASIGSAETMADALGIGATMAAPVDGGGATLPGPYKVADLPTLPRVDDTTYAIGDEIARGGMGKILAARDRRLRRDVVIKVVRRESGRIDPRFEREALITARLQHPSIVRVYDAGVLGDGRAFYAMEHVRGRSLEVVLEGARTLRDRLALMPHAIAVCDALAYAHNEGVVHRDLKPSNVLLGPFGETVVIDWGLAKDLRANEPETVGGAGPAPDQRDSQLTQHGAVMGTPLYMAPEQARGELADERTDIYALGALLYTMFTGSPPVSGNSSDEVLDAVASGRRTKIGEAEPELPAELVTIVEHAMAHDATARYASAKSLADDLRSFAAGKLVATHAYSTWELVKRWIARHRISIAIGAIALVLLAVTGVVAVRNVLRERDIAKQAQREAEQARYVAETAKDRFVLQQARSSFDGDPSRAAAWLKNLSSLGLGWPETAAFAAQLTTAGIAFELEGHKQDVELTIASPDGTHVATGSDDTTIRWWDLATRGSLELIGHTGPLELLSISSDGKHLASAGTDHLAILWDLATGASKKLVGHTGTARVVAFSPDNTKLASTGNDGSLFLWDVATGAGTKLLQYKYALRPVVWLDATHLLIGAFSGDIGKVDIETKQVMWTTGVHHAEMRTIAVTPAGDYWIMGDEDGRVTMWNAHSGKMIHELAQHEDVARKAMITADGKFAVTCGGDSAVHVYSIPDGVYTKLEGNTSGIKDIDVRGDLVVSAGIDTVVRVWKIDGTLVHTFRGHRAAVKGVAFVGDHIVSGSEDDLARVWPLSPLPPPPSGEALRGWLDTYTNVEISSKDHR